MYTVCPKCALPLAVTAADLRAGQGYVRCGRCANVFNALLRLSEESALGPGEHEAVAPPYIEEMGTASATMSRPALPEPLATPSPPPAPPASAPPEERRAKRPLYLEPEFYDPEITNPKIGMAPLSLVPPADERPASGIGLYLVDTPPRPPPEDEIFEDPLEQSVEYGPLPDAMPDSWPAEVTGEATALEEATGEPRENEEADESPSGEYRGTGTFETIVLEGDTFLQTEETIPEEVLASEIANVSRRIAQAHNTAEFAALMESHFGDEPEEESQLDGNAPSESEEDPAPELAALREATGEFRRQSNATDEDYDPAEWFEAVKAWGDWRMIAAAAVLAGLAIVQMLNHWRDDLATQAGWFGPMRALSSALGEPLRPNWNLNAYDVRQLGAAAEATDSEVLKVRLSLTNIGDRAQALPMIRLTLRDRYGKAVSRGELEPDQYLPEVERGHVMIRRDERIDTELRVVDPSRQATSFELDVCVAAAGGGLRCAGDSPALAARQP